MTLSKILTMFPGKSSLDGSSWLPFWLHSMDTAGIMDRLVDSWLPEHFADACSLDESELRKACRFLALTHDIGKLTPVFAARIFNSLPELRSRLERAGLPVGYPNDYLAGETKHAMASEAILLQSCCPAGIAAIVGAHHGRTQTSGMACEENPGAYPWNYYHSDAAQPVWNSLREEWLCFALFESGYSTAEELPQPSQAVQLLLTGLLIMADWLASNTSYFPLIPTDHTGSRAQLSVRVTAAWEKLHLPESWSPLCFAMDAPGFKDVFGFSPNPVQEQMLKTVNTCEDSGIFILEAQMGIGKTEAALAAAEILASKSGCGGVFFGLPTQATANGLFERLKNWAEKQSEGTRQSIRLAHGMAELNEAYRSLFCGNAAVDEDGEDGVFVHPWFNGRKQALLADFVIGTVDQLLMASLKQKHLMLRHLGLAGKVVILDECHAYDAYMNQYLDRTLNWLGRYKIPVIILSATLPEKRRVELVEAYLNRKLPECAEWRTKRSYPLLTWTEGDKVKQATVETGDSSHRVAIRSLNAADWLAPLREAVSAGGCCGVIVNTVQRAQELAQTAREQLPTAHIMLQHSRFTASDRAAIESEFLRLAGKDSTPEDRAGLIVIGTQVLEQSLDVDFDVLVTQLCPMDLLLQRIGRLHRHRNRSRPERLAEARCYVLEREEESDSGSRKVYGDWLLLRTRALLPDTVLLPQSIPELVQETYREPDATLLADDTLRQAWEAHEKKIRDKENRADCYRLSAPQKPAARHAKTIDGLLNTRYPADGVRGEAAVRDGVAGISVLAMQERRDGRICFFPWQQVGESLSATHVPDDETAREIVRQRLTLPQLFSYSWEQTSACIDELERINKRRLSEWQHSPWLQGELILLFDEQFCAELCGLTLRYTKEYGLITERKADDNGREL